MEFFGRTYDWFKRNRGMLETAYAFPTPIPPGTYLIYYADEVAAWRAARKERACRAVLERQVTHGAALKVELIRGAAEGTAFFEPPAAEAAPDRDALKGEKPA